MIYFRRIVLISSTQFAWCLNAAYIAAPTIRLEYVERIELFPVCLQSTPTARPL